MRERTGPEINTWLRNSVQGYSAISNAEGCKPSRKSLATTGCPHGRPQTKIDSLRSVADRPAVVIY